MGSNMYVRAKIKSIVNKSLECSAIFIEYIKKQKNSTLIYSSAFILHSQLSRVADEKTCYWIC